MDLTTLLIVAIVCAAIGYFTGILISNWRSEGKSPEEDEEGGLQEVSKDQNVILKVLRDDEGELLVEFDGKLYQKAARISKKDRSRFEYVWGDLQKWYGINPEDQQNLQLPEATLSGEKVDIPPKSIQPKKDGSFPASKGKSMAKNDSIALEQKSMVKQIEDILQELLTGTAFEDRGIHIEESQDNGVSVRIGSEHYAGIEDIPDAEIKALLHQAVEVWESRV